MDVTESGEVNKEGRCHSSATVTLNSGNTTNKNETIKCDKPVRDESSHYQRQFIPTCIPPYTSSVSTLSAFVS